VEAGFRYYVDADWDPEAEVWVATSDDLPGLATEAPTLEALAEKLKTLIPELLTDNHQELDRSRAREAEDRITAFEAGEIQEVSGDRFFAALRTRRNARPG
jgi:predicted RNase H-like HicB family nuclease